MPRYLLHTSFFSRLSLSAPDCVTFPSSLSLLSLSFLVCSSLPVCSSCFLPFPPAVTLFFLHLLLSCWVFPPHISLFNLPSFSSLPHSYFVLYPLTLFTPSLLLFHLNRPSLQHLPMDPYFAAPPSLHRPSSPTGPHPASSSPLTLPAPARLLPPPRPQCQYNHPAETLFDLQRVRSLYTDLHLYVDFYCEYISRCSFHYLLYSVVKWAATLILLFFLELTQVPNPHYSSQFEKITVSGEMSMPVISALLTLYQYQIIDTWHACHVSIISVPLMTHTRLHASFLSLTWQVLIKALSQYCYF